jgi:hypothetical protein
MTPTQKKRMAIEAKAGELGFAIDRWGSWRRESDGRQYRLKFQKTSVRYEVKSSDDWVNIISDYFKNIQVIQEGISIKGRLVK